MKRARLTHLVLCLSLAVLAFAEPARAAETVVRNDALDPNGTGAIQAGFVAGESAAAWLTAPCSGTIVAVQIYWRSYFGGSIDTLGDTITIFSAGTFPSPGAVKQNNYAPYQNAIFEGPILVDGVLNEFRYLDEQSTIPLRVSINAGETFVVSFKFLDTPGLLDPSVITDTNGCQNGKNAVDASGSGWMNPCSVGMSGDFVIRAVIDCQDPTGACCHAYGTCSDGVTQSACQAEFGGIWSQGLTCTQVTCTHRGACCRAGGCLTLVTPSDCQGIGGLYAGDATDCNNAVCVAWACCMPDGSCSSKFEFQCAAQGGTFHPNTTCSPNPCPQPTGACRFDTFCLANQTQAACTGAQGAWVGPLTTCGPPNPCATPSVCRGDANCDHVISWRDIDYFVAAQNDSVSAWWKKFLPATPGCTFANCDVNNDGHVSWRDITPFVSRMNMTCP